MADDLMEQFVAPQLTYMGKPHMCIVIKLDSRSKTNGADPVLEICFVHPAFRRRSVGRLLVKWGVAKADEMGVGSYFDATAEGKPLYEAYGFGAAKALDFSLDTYDASPTREKLEDQLLPFSWWPMWRPVGGKSATTESKKPWE